MSYFSAMKAKYDLIGKEYNATRRADPYLFSRMLHHLAPSSHGKYLDIGCGTGNYTKEFDKKGIQFIGVDPSSEMLEKADDGNNNIHWMQGSAENIDAPSESFEGAVASLTMHHWTNLHQGFSSLYRVIKDNGRLVLFTATPKQMEGYWLHHYFPKMMKDSMLVMPSLELIESGLSGNNFQIVKRELYDIKPDLQDLFLYSGKFEPKKYFNEQIRNGISSFSAVANAKEVESGLARMKKDVSTGEIEKVMKLYENDLGDYLFLVAEKK